MSAFKHLNRCDFAVPVVRSPFQAERAIGATILMWGYSALQLAWTNDCRGVRKKRRERNTYLVVIAVRSNDRIKAQIVIYAPFVTDQPVNSASKCLYTCTLRSQSLWCS
jgi:hypothetical protein